MSITDDLRMAMARVWDEWADLHGVAAPAHIVYAWLSVTIAADALDAEVAALTAQRDAAQAVIEAVRAEAERMRNVTPMGFYPEASAAANATENCGDAIIDVLDDAGASPVAADPPTEEQQQPLHRLRLNRGRSLHRDPPTGEQQ